MVYFKRLTSQNQVEVWVLPLPIDLTEMDLSWVKSSEILGKRDLKRYQSFKVKTKKNEILISRIFINWLLSKYVSNEKEGIQIIPDQYGKPFLYKGNDKLPLYFNLSHTMGMMTCTFSTKQMIGADVEYILPKFKIDAKLIFSPEEINWCKSDDQSSQQRYYTLWTLKEAFLKAVGRGFSAPIDTFGFSFHDNKIKINFHDVYTYGSSNLWHFSSTALSSKHILSQAVKSVDNPTFNYIKLDLSHIGI